MELRQEDLEAVTAAIREAENRTSGQIVCVIAHASSDYAYVPVLWASAIALFVPWPLILFTPWSVQRIYLIQLVIFIVVGLVLSLMPLRFARAAGRAARARPSCCARAVFCSPRRPYQEP